MSSAAQRQDSKRRFPRFTVNFSAGFRCMSDGQWSTGSVTDLGRGGLCLVTTRELNMGEIIEILVQKQTGEGKPHMLIATIVWKKGDRYGLSFLT